MNPNVRVTGRPPSGSIHADDLRALADACAAVLPTLSWVGATFDPSAGVISEDGRAWRLQLALPRGGPTMMTELMQAVGLTALCSRARPDWVFELSCDSGVLEAELGDSPCLRDGRSVRDDAGLRKAMVKYVEDPRRFGVEPIALDHSQDFLIDTSFLYDPAHEAPAAPAPAPSWTDEGPPLWIEATNAGARPHPTEVVVASWRVRSLPRDADGDLPIEAEVRVFNALTGGGRVGMMLDLVDAEGVLLCSLTDTSRTTLHEGEAIDLRGRAWRRGPALPRDARVRLWIQRSEGTIVSLGRARPVTRPPDADGEIYWELRFELHNPGPAWDDATLRLQWTDAHGEPDEAGEQASLGPIPAGLSVHEMHGMLMDREVRYAGRAAVLSVELLRTRWQRVGDAEVLCLRLPDPAAPAAPPAPVQAVPVQAVPDLPPVEAPAQPALSLDDRLKSADAATVIAACEEVAREVDRSRTSRVRALLGHADAGVRAAAASALGFIGGPALTVPLRRLIQDPDATVRAAATEAITRLGG